jgi:predicted TIM-barrel fold metal-dependent hydrolase
MLELEHRFRVVDVHARLAPGQREHGPTATPDRLERELRQAGVVRAVVCPDGREEGYLAANNAVARKAVGRPFVAVARLNGVHDPAGGPAARARNLAARRRDHHTSPAEVERYAYDDRFQGFALDPAVDGLPDPKVLDRMETVDRPVLVRGRRRVPLAVLAEAVLDRSFPVVLTHFGGHPLDREAMTEAVDRLDRHDGLFLDTSTVRYRDLLERALREHPDRVVFGSGAPDVHPNVAVMELLTLDVPEGAMRRAFSENASRVFEALAPT